MWTANSAHVSCQSGIPVNSAEETQDIHDAIEEIAAISQLDHRFILAIIMQESSGCVRVNSTNFGVENPGLMQDHDGTGTCNTGNSTSGTGGVTVPCPDSEIVQMIEDGSQGTAAGDGLVQIINRQTVVGSQAFYITARTYNSGSVPADGDLGGCPGATACYASDIANRLTGWVTAASTCTLSCQ